MRETDDNQEVVADIEKSMRYISAIIKQKGREILSGYSITPPQFVALQWLYESGDMTIGELSNNMYLACSTTTDLIDRMEKNSLVMRVRNPKDRRVVQIHMQEEGARIIEEVIQKRQEYLASVTGDFTADELADLDYMLRKLYDEMKD